MHIQPEDSKSSYFLIRVHLTMLFVLFSVLGELSDEVCPYPQSKQWLLGDRRLKLSKQRCALMTAVSMSVERCCLFQSPAAAPRVVSEDHRMSVQERVIDTIASRLSHLKMRGSRGLRHPVCVPVP